MSVELQEESELDDEEDDDEDGLTKHNRIQLVRFIIHLIEMKH